MSVEVRKTAVRSEALLGLGVHDGLSIAALRRGEGRLLWATIKGGHCEVVGRGYAVRAILVLRRDGDGGDS